MAKQRYKKLPNSFDLTLIVIALILSAIAIYSSVFYKSPSAANLVAMVVKVPADNIEIAAKNDKQVYFNGVDRFVTVSRVVKEDGSLLITLVAPGQTNMGDFVFNGQRVLINQKAEIRGSYFSQGRIVSISNASK